MISVPEIVLERISVSTGREDDLVGLAHRAVDGLGRRTEEFGTGAIKSLRQFKALAAAFAGSGSIGNTHFLLLLYLSDPAAHARRSW